MSGKLSQRRFAALDSDEQQPVDTRPAALDRLITVPGDVMDALSDVFAGTGLLGRFCKPVPLRVCDPTSAG